MGEWGRIYLAGLGMVVTVRWRDVDTGEVFSEAFPDRLDAAHAITQVQRIMNLELVAVECETPDQLAAFREYCGALKPAGVRF